MKPKQSNPTKIKTLQELASALLDADKSDYHRILRSIDVENNEFDEVGSWSTDRYTRNCVVENESFELILLCWEKDQVTPIHNHGGEECWVYSIDGEFKETIFKPNEEGVLVNSGERYLKPGNITYMIDFMGFHNLENVTGQRSCSLHLYAKPIKNCKVFNETTSELTTKELCYDTVLDIVSIN